MIAFLLVPLYTYCITDPAEFGYYDLCVAVIFCLSPVCMLQLNDGGFRFLIETDDAERKSRIITFVYRTVVRNFVIIAFMAAIISVYVNISYLWYCVAFLIINTYYDITLQILRGLGDNKEYVRFSIVTAFTIGLLNVLLVFFIRLEVAGIFLSNIIARIIGCICIEAKLHIWSTYFKPLSKDTVIGRELLKYSLPLLPGGICWWLIGSANKFFIERYIGLNENGLYAVANKYSAILYTFAFVFYQAWQENAVRQYNQPDKNRFFSAVFQNYFYVLSFLCIVFPFFIRLNYGWLVGEGYRASASMLYLLAVSAILSALSQYFDLGYQCSKSTSRTLPSIGFAALVNVVGNIIMTPRFGINGILWVNVFTFFTLVIYRFIDCRKYFRLTIDKKIYGEILLVIIGGILYCYYDDIKWNIGVTLCTIVLYSAFVPSEVKNMVIGKFKRKAR